MKSAIGIFILFIGVLYSGTTMAYEEPEYEVIEKDGNFELRQYGPSVVAEVLLEGEPGTVDREAFFILAGYIQGNNEKKTDIPMTAPVSQQPVSETIPMTAPVNRRNEGDTWRITFFLPREYTIETAPEPLDSRVIIREEQGGLVAALRYSGSWSRDKYNKKETELVDLIQSKNLSITGNPVFARYNAPYMPWFMRRNEVLIPVEKNL